MMDNRFLFWGRYLNTRSTGKLLSAVFAVFFFLPLFFATAAVRIDVVYPPAGSTVPLTEQGYVIGSVSPATAPLTCNGKKVIPFRTGGFLVMVPLKAGKNVLLFQSGTVKAIHSFLVKKASLPAENVISSVSPCISTGVLLTEPVPLACSAPAGRQVYAMVGERNIRLFSSSDSPALYRGTVSFSSPVEKVPVVFWSDGLPDAPAGEITARSLWPSYVVTGNLFEVRARLLPNEGETVGFLPPGFVFHSSGFSGENIRIPFSSGRCFVLRSMVSPHKETGIASVPQTIPDLANGYPARPAKGKRPGDLLIVVDAGHGGTDSGAIGPCRKQEKEANLSQAKRIAATLKEAGFRVLMTRTSDTAIGLYDRVRLAYSRHADAFLSIHHNATSSGRNPMEARSIMTFAWNERGRALAECVEPRIAAVAGIPDHGVERKSLAVCRNPAVPSCLIEFDFINCPEGEADIFDVARQKRFADAVTQGVKDWMNASR